MGCHKGRQATEASGNCMHDLQGEEDKVRSCGAKVCPVQEVRQGVQVYNSVSLGLIEIVVKGCLGSQRGLN